MCVWPVARPACYCCCCSSAGDSTNKLAQAGTDAQAGVAREGATIDDSLSWDGRARSRCGARNVFPRSSHAQSLGDIVVLGERARGAARYATGTLSCSSVRATLGGEGTGAGKRKCTLPRPPPPPFGEKIFWSLLIFWPWFFPSAISSVG